MRLQYRCPCRALEASVAWSPARDDSSRPRRQRVRLGPCFSRSRSGQAPSWVLKLRVGRHPALTASRPAQSPTSPGTTANIAISKPCRSILRSSSTDPRSDLRPTRPRWKKNASGSFAARSGLIASGPATPASTPPAVSYVSNSLYQKSICLARQFPPPTYRFPPTRFPPKPSSS